MCDDESQRPLPPFPEQVRNFILAVGRAAREAKDGGKVIAGPDLRAVRIRKCVQCSEWSDGKCAVSGGSIRLKVSLKAENCPKKEW